MKRKGCLKRGELKSVKAVKIIIFSTVLFIILAAASCAFLKSKRIVETFSEQEIIKKNPDVICFSGVNIVPMNENIIYEDMNVTISDGVIFSIMPSTAADLPEGVIVIDGSGKYLIPGLTDMHIHEIDLPDNTAIMFLANGVTTVRFMEGFPELIEIKELVMNNKILSPDIFTSGPILDGNPPSSQELVSVSNAEEAKAAVIECVNEGYDYIKLL